MRALLPCLIAVSAFCNSGRVLAEPWSTQPLVGVVGQYDSNPVLAASNTQSETNAALVLNLPVNYDEDDFHFVATPNIRYGNASGYSAVTSNSFHLDSTAQLSNELGSTSVTAAVYRDSSLLYAGELSNGVGVRRDSSSLSVDWQRALAERLQVQVGASSFRTLYAQTTPQDDSQSAGAGGILGTLADFRYSSFSPALAFAQNERDTFRLIGAVGRYEALDEVSDQHQCQPAARFRPAVERALDAQDHRRLFAGG